MSSQLFQQAVTAVRTGDRQQGRDLLIQLVQQNPEHELAWLWLSDLVEDLDDQIIALENALTLNPGRIGVQTRLDQLRQQKEINQINRHREQGNYLTLGRIYSQRDDWEKAVDVYKKAVRQAKTSVDRQLAKEQLQVARKQLKLARVVRTSPTTTLIRLAVGPPVLFGMLILLHAGLRPWAISPFLCLGGLSVLLGSLLLTSIGKRAVHPLWRRFLAANPTLPDGQRALLRLLGVLLILVPFILFVASALNRLALFSEAPFLTP